MTRIFDIVGVPLNGTVRVPLNGTVRVPLNGTWKPDKFLLLKDKRYGFCD